MTIHAEFIAISRRKLRHGGNRIEGCLGRLSEEQVWSREHAVENSIGNLVLHLCGNIRQLVISTLGGKPDSRDRDAEFSRRETLPKAELLTLLNETLDAADRVLDDLDPGALLATRKFQANEWTALHAIYHAVDHFAGHVGQIIWATKRMTGEDLGFRGYRAVGGNTGGGGVPSS